jgi:uncharacterized protein (TIGR02186 family)
LRVGVAQKLAFLCLTALVPSACTGASADQGAADLRVSPQSIRAGTLYRGAEVHIAADIPLSDGAVIKIEGGNKELVLNRKGKLGIVWLNVAKVMVKNAPQIYILASSDALEEICSQEDRKRLGLGFDALKGELEFESEKPLTGSEFHEFLKLKRHSGAYSADQSAELKPAGAGRQELSAVLSVPPTIPPGEYKVLLYYFRDRSLAGEAEATLSIEEVGFPLLMTDLAYEHAGPYGILAIVVAMVAGVVIGLVFSARRGRAH